MAFSHRLALFSSSSVKSSPTQERTSRLSLRPRLSTIRSFLETISLTRRPHHLQSNKFRVPFIFSASCTFKFYSFLSFPLVASCLHGGLALGSFSIRVTLFSPLDFALGTSPREADRCLWSKTTFRKAGSLSSRKGYILTCCCLHAQCNH